MKFNQSYSVTLEPDKYCPYFTIDWQYKTCRCGEAQRFLSGTREVRIGEIEPCIKEDMEFCPFKPNQNT